MEGNDRKWVDYSGTNEFNHASDMVTGTPTAVAMNKGNGKLAAFMQIAEEHRAHLLRFAWRMTDCREDAEDIVQLALTKAFANLSRFRGESQMATWLHVIVRNTATEFLRNRRGRSLVSLEYARCNDDTPVVHDVPDPRRNPEEYCERREMEDVLFTEMDRLDSVCKLAIQMCVLDGLSQRAAANTLNISVSTIKSRIFRGKRMLKRAICLHTED